ncbi:hypothetical protein G6O69_16825 [Pseudenhygromyxa sp. WMMC2535]|uniref:hypothetical protein n=1 Tax=Pseudenhygromyxa sp. WMMC2535 TaxID=2712867 RepID=UPI0015545878|nr:hypothetical protein [Pseudenhygromyxa sp. WMMC2535]NVB39508.1 hypothetical protein [Pseudenhygromyxa sp. WMMC2535]
MAHGRAPVLRGAQLLTLLWAVTGVLAVLVDAIVRLLPRALEPVMAGELDFFGAAAYLAAMVGLGYSEGYRGFQCRFSPRVAARAMHLARTPSPWWLIALAPAMVMGLVHATRRRLIGSWGLVGAIITMILLVRMLDQPWRGAVDAGVVIGLGWGAVATVGWAATVLRGRDPGIELDLPEDA